jgi:hypothetical protein
LEREKDGCALRRLAGGAGGRVQESGGPEIIIYFEGAHATPQHDTQDILNQVDLYE